MRHNLLCIIQALDTFVLAVFKIIWQRFWINCAKILPSHISSLRSRSIICAFSQFSEKHEDQTNKESDEERDFQGSFTEDQDLKAHGGTGIIFVPFLLTSIRSEIFFREACRQLQKWHGRWKPQEPQEELWGAPNKKAPARHHCPALSDSHCVGWDLLSLWHCTSLPY